MFTYSHMFRYASLGSVIAGSFFLGGCMSVDRHEPFEEITQLFSPSVKDDPDAVNFWPIYTRNQDVRSIMWPLIKSADEQFSLRPIYNYDRGVHDLFLGVVSADFQRDEYRVFPIWWYFPERELTALLPVYYRSFSPNKVVSVSPNNILWTPLGGRTKMGRDHTKAWLSPIPGIWQYTTTREYGKTDGIGTLTADLRIFPLMNYKSSGDEDYSLRTLLGGRSYEAATHRTHTWLLPFSGLWEYTTNQVDGQDDANAFATNLTIFPLLRRTYTPKHNNVPERNTLNIIAILPLYTHDLSGDSVSIFTPLYEYDYIVSEGSYKEDPENDQSPSIPYTVTSQSHGFALNFFYTNSYTRSDSPLINTRTRIFGGLLYENAHEPSYWRVGLTPQAPQQYQFYAFSFLGLYSAHNITQTNHDTTASGRSYIFRIYSENTRKWDINKSDERHIRERSILNGLIYQDSYGSYGDGHFSLREMSILPWGLLYNYNYNCERIIGRQDTRTETAFLCYLYRFQRDSDGATQQYIFPFIERHTLADGETEMTSFLWRVWRREKTPTGKLRYHLFFIPFGG